METSHRSFPLGEGLFLYNLEQKKDHLLLVILFERITFPFRCFLFDPEDSQPFLVRL